VINDMTYLYSGRGLKQATKLLTSGGNSLLLIMLCGALYKVLRLIAEKSHAVASSSQSYVGS